MIKMNKVKKMSNLFLEKQKQKIPLKMKILKMNNNQMMKKIIRLIKNKKVLKINKLLQKKMRKRMKNNPITLLKFI